MSAYALPGPLFPPVKLRPSRGELSSECRSDSWSPSTSPQHKETTSADSHAVTKNESTRRTAEVGIAVKKGRIDPSHLVKAPRRRNLSSYPQDDFTSSGKEFNDGVVQLPHGDAIEFELSISLNGRDYSAKRSLPSIIQLRNELIREVNRRRNGSQLGWRRPKATFDHEPKFIDKDDDTVETVESEYDDDMVDVTIPELPDCIADNAESVSTGGVGARGFRLLQAVIHSYCPVIERWLRHVADIVPPSSSPCLMKFLWEPLSQGSEVRDLRPLKKHGSFSTSLDSIDEYENLEEEKEETDDRVLVRKVVAQS